MRKDRLLAKKPKAGTKTEQPDREAHQRLEHSDMDLVDRFMRKLVRQVPVEKSAKQPSRKT